MKVRSHSYTRIINERYVKLDDGRFFGLLKRDNIGLKSQLEYLIESKNNNKPFYRSYGSIDYFVKKLRNDELGETPPERFVNSVIIDDYINERCGGTKVITPVGIIYEGRPLNLLESGMLNAYFISYYVKGERLFHLIKRLDEDKMEKIFRSLNLNLNALREKRLYLLDFAPRDIVIDDNGAAVLLDMEHLEFANSFDRKKQDEFLLARQKREFHKDYDGFLNKEQLKKAEILLFNEIK